MAEPAPGLAEDDLLAEELGITLEAIGEYRDAFRLFDTDNDGSITFSELSKVMTSLGKEVDAADLQSMIEHYDEDSDGVIEFPEFLSVMTKIMNDVDTDEELIEVFRVLDQDGDGYISKGDLREVVLRLGSKLTNQDMEEMFTEADKDGDGHIDYEEFLKLVQSRI